MMGLKIIKCLEKKAVFSAEEQIDTVKNIWNTMKATQAWGTPQQVLQLESK